MLFHPKTIVNRNQVFIIGTNWRIITRRFQSCWSMSQSNQIPVGGSCQSQFSKVSYKNIYWDIISICTGMFSLLVNIEQWKWQTWSHTHVDVCRHLSWLIPANDGQSESLILSCLSNLTFRCFKIFHNKIVEFTGTT